MTDLTPEHLLTVIDRETLEKIWRFCRGSRICFPSAALEKKDIAEYVEMRISSGGTTAEAVRGAAERFGKSQSWVRRIVKTGGAKPCPNLPVHP